MVYKVVLYGSGKYCKILCKILKQSDIQIAAIFDSNSTKWGEEVAGHIVLPPDEICHFFDAYLCIAVADSNIVKQIRQELRQLYQYDVKREIHYNKLIIEAYKKNAKIKHLILNSMRDSTRDITILFDCYNGLKLGGVESWTMELCESLIKSGKNNIYIISDKGKYQVSQLIEENIIYVDIEHKERFSMCSILNLVKAIMEKMPCKIVTSTTNEVMLAAYLIKCYFPDMIEIISVIHNSNERVYEEYMDFRECSDIYVSVSQDIKRDMISRDVESEKIYTMTCPFACDQVLIRTYTEDALSPIHIGYAGRMDGMKHFQKRMDLLVMLAKRLHEKRVCFNMEFAGDGPARKEMEEFVHNNKLCQRVHFLGRLERSEMSFFWKRQDICVNLADYEGRSISIIEAMGNGAVPIVTATSGVREDIVDGMNGYIVPLEDVNAVVAKIEYLAAHREQLCAMGKLAHDIVYPKSLMEPHLEFWKELFGMN